MKIQVLSLDAFGPFTDRVLRFESSGLHIVYGPNEAGKSSALRGLKALLYGIDERTTDNHLHANDKLRISGLIQSTAGEKLSFTRRKGRKNTLLSADGGTLDEQLLVSFLHGVNSELFEMLFGIDHQALIQGGEEILEQKGEVGQALFSASLGTHTLHTVLGQFDDEADGLFRPRGSTQKINAALKSYTQLNKHLRENSLTSREWEKKRHRLERTTEELEKVKTALTQHRVEMSRLQRIQRVLPKIARRHEFMQELEALGDVVTLANDFTERRRAALHGLEIAKAHIVRLSPRLTALQEKLETLSINHEMLAQEENIEDLHARLGAHRKALKDRPNLETERQQLLCDAESILKEVRPDLAFSDIDLLRPVLARRLAISELGSKSGVLNSQLEQTVKNQRETESRLKRVQAERDEAPEPKSPDALRRMIATARKSGDIDATIHTVHSEIAELEQQCNDALSRLSLWNGALEDVVRLPVPGRETINRFEAGYDEIEKQRQRLAEKKAETTSVLNETSQKLEEIQRTGMVPTESDLVAIRTERDRVWQLLRRQWEAGEDITTEAAHFLAEGELADVFELRVSRSDELSDRLLREAERVHALANLQVRQEELQRQAETLEDQLAGCSGDLAKLNNDWLAEWAPCQIEPRTPREMRGWLDDLERLRDQAELLNQEQRKLEGLKQIREQHSRQLREQLSILGEDDMAGDQIEPLLLTSEELVQYFEDAKHKREVLDKEVRDRTAELEEQSESHRRATAELETWKEQWSEMIQEVGLRQDATATEAAEFIEQVRLLFTKQVEAEKVALRLKAIDEDSDTFRGQVADIVNAIAPELNELPGDEAVIRLNALLSENRIKYAEQKNTREALDQVEQELQESTSKVDEMSDRLDDLCTEAKCNSRDELEDKEQKSADYLRLREQVASVEGEMLEAGDGATLSQLETEASSEEPDSIPARIDDLSRVIDEELEPRRTELAETKGREQKELELMDGNDKAAELADDAQAILATIRNDAERFVRSKLAGRILRDQIERYRKENQGPLIKRASKYFSELTLGSFGGLMADFNEKDEPVLVGVRTNGDKVYVEGMSSGSRDQLYLALRLASLEKYMDNSEPMPFIVDDVLVDFDDERSEAALKAMEQLAEKTQVILFTHHSRVVEQANKLENKDKVTVHEL